MSWISIKDLSFSYGSRPIFEHLNLEVEKGQIFCLVGPNGCGKTTLQHCILNFLKPYSGSILLDGRQVRDYSAKELAAKMAFVPQNHTRSFPYRTVDVVAMGSLRMRGFFGGTGREDTERAMEMLRCMQIDHLAECEYTSLSGGELQMVLIARALCQDSEMILLDEPTAHLDIRKSQEILEYITEFSKNQGKTIFITTHDFNQPLFFQDAGSNVRMALMHEGKLGCVGEPLEVLVSEPLKETYGMESRILEVEADGKKMHYLATWKPEKK